MTDVVVENEKVYRKMSDFETAKKIVNILNSTYKNDERIVKTTIYSEDKKLLQHQYISPIIHSGEYTTSMAIDVTETIFDMALEYLNSKIYLADALPHNYTYYKGHWILYDFGAFETTPKNVKTLVRNSFKITFSSLELLKKLSRKELKEYFLNRISYSYFKKMVDFNTIVNYTIKSTLCLSLCKLNLNKQAYSLAKYFFKQYQKKLKKEYFNNKIIENEKNLYLKVDELLRASDIKKIFCLGNETAKWTLNTQNTAEKFVYIDDYDKCDKFYNYIYKNKISNLATAVVYPFIDDDKINKNLSFRGIYDIFAKERFNSDTVVILDMNKLLENKEFELTTFVHNITDFSKKSAIFVFKKDKNESTTKSKMSDLLQQYYIHVVETDCEQYSIIFANAKIVQFISQNTEYLNANRGPYCKLHSQKILELLKKN